MADAYSFAGYEHNKYHLLPIPLRSFSLICPWYPVVQKLKFQYVPPCFLLFTFCLIKEIFLTLTLYSWECCSSHLWVYPESVGLGVNIRSTLTSPIGNWLSQSHSLYRSFPQWFLTSNTSRVYTNTQVCFWDLYSLPLVSLHAPSLCRHHTTGLKKMESGRPSPVILASPFQMKILGEVWGLNYTELID